MYEDGRQLGPAHRPHDFIRADGRGQFSHWGSTLYFSSSDNTDPRANGRVYRFITGATASGEFLGWWAICALAVTGLAYWLRRTRRAASDAPRAWKIAVTATIVATYALLVRYSMDPDAGAWIPRGQMLPALWAVSFAASLAAARQVGLSLADFTYDSIETIQRTWGELLTRANRPFMRSGWEGRVWRAVSLALPVILFAIVLRMRLPYGLLMASYFFATPLLLPFGLALWCCHLRRDWIGTISGLAVTLVLFGLPLASLWWHIGTHYNAVGGLLPFSDASGYYYDARRLLQGYPFDWSARRPLFPGLLSTLLALTGDNLQVTLAMLVAFNGVATYLLARELRAEPWRCSGRCFDDGSLFLLSGGRRAWHGADRESRSWDGRHRVRRAVAELQSPRPVWSEPGAWIADHRADGAGRCVLRPSRARVGGCTGVPGEVVARGHRGVCRRIPFSRSDALREPSLVQPVGRANGVLEFFTVALRPGGRRQGLEPGDCWITLEPQREHRSTHWPGRRCARIPWALSKAA